MTSSEPIDAPDLPAVLSMGRHSTYLKACHGNPSQAMRLYAWNIGVSAAMWGGFNVLEVALRNALSTQLASWTRRSDWWNSAVPLHPPEVAKVASVVASCERQHGDAVTPGHIVADLTFGFWVKLLTRGYHQRLWVPALQQAFVERDVLRRDLYWDLDRLRKLRNRVAHHEPIFARDLAVDHVKIIHVLSLINLDAAAWVAHDSRVPHILATRDDMVTGAVTTSF